MQVRARLPPLIAALLALGLAVVGHAASKRLEVEDVAGIVQVLDPQLSPDGRSIVFVLARPNPREARYDKSLVLIDIASGGQRVLTYGRRGVGMPRWSPSGDRIAFLDVVTWVSAATASEPASPTDSVGRAHYQVLVMPMSGGDPRPITSGTQDVEQFAWSPDGRQIAYVMSDEDPHAREIAQHRDAFEVKDNGYLATAAEMPSHLWLVAAEGGPARRLTSGAWSLPKSQPPSAPASPLSWSPDGKRIAIVQQATPYWGDTEQTVIATLDVASGQLHKLTSHENLEGYPLYSPDGTQLAYWYSRDGDPNNENDVFVTGTNGGTGLDVTRALDRDIWRTLWTADGRSLLLAAHDGTRVALWLQQRDGAARELDLAEVIPNWSYWVDLSLGKDGAFTFPGSTTTHPNEIYYVPAGGTPRRLTAFNQGVAEDDLGRAEPFKWSGPDGGIEDGVVVYPPGFSARRRYPLVLVIHGGPQSANTVAFNSIAQLLAAHDYVVFSPNYRGSDNMGNAFQRAIVNDPGDGPGRDVMAGIQALEQLGFIDASRIGVSGWSYGGYMTTWLLGHYHIWKAAVSGAAVTDLVQEYALSDYNVIERFSLGGPPWSEQLLQAYRAQSPISYARDITAPTLILADTGDARVPITQSYLLYHALKDSGVPVQFFAYPVPGHTPGDPARLPDVYRRWVEWMDRYLRNPYRG
jgi:dipeptidyl aminopeptidase/acylaminoacyl peptidase